MEDGADGGDGSGRGRARRTHVGREHTGGGRRTVGGPRRGGRHGIGLAGRPGEAGRSRPREHTRSRPRSRCRHLRRPATRDQPAVPARPTRADVRAATAFAASLAQGFAFSGARARPIRPAPSSGSRPARATTPGAYARRDPVAEPVTGAVAAGVALSGARPGRRATRTATQPPRDRARHGGALHHDRHCRHRGLRHAALSGMLSGTLRGTLSGTSAVRPRPQVVFARVMTSSVVSGLPGWWLRHSGVRTLRKVAPSTAT